MGGRARERWSFQQQAETPSPSPSGASEPPLLGHRRLFPGRHHPRTPAEHAHLGGTRRRGRRAVSKWPGRAEGEEGAGDGRRLSRQQRAAACHWFVINEPPRERIAATLVRRIADQSITDDGCSNWNRGAVEPSDCMVLIDTVKSGLRKFPQKPLIVRA